MKVETIRAMVGASQFKRQLKKFATRKAATDNAPLASGATMDHEPENRGLKIPEARAALSRASKRRYDLPSASSLKKD